MNHVDSAALRSDEKSDRPHDPVFYAETLNRLLDLPACVGYHLCGGYLKNIARQYGFRHARNRVAPYVADMARTNYAAAIRFAKEVA